MNQAIHLRSGTAGDLPLIEALYRQAFPEEDLVPLVRSLLQEPEGVLSLVATRGKRLVGHVVFTRCTVEPSGHVVALLGPLCAAPDLQKQGIGSRLVREGVKQVEAWPARQVLVLGDPNYYGRFGFLPSSPVTPPYPLPAEWSGAWQSLDFANSRSGEGGTLSVPPPWRDRSLWSD